MSTLTITLDDAAARLVAEAARTTNQPVERWLRDSICQAAARTVAEKPARALRVSPLHRGAMQAAEDFNASMEEFAPYV